MAASYLTDGLGAAAALCSMVSFAPQLTKIWREKDASAVSRRMYLVSVAGFTMWTTYGVLIGRWPVILCNAVCLAMCLAILALAWRYGDTAPA
ncbi:SemiSWEET family sugar transporter [Caulobacter sp. KR2-114]|uniref:SemiSWEET family sugar transporter n=1 Tax=Caulobacter sp. KR2-114 TaxID=3400912 RepID=UPI003C0C0D54